MKIAVIIFLSGIALFSHAQENLKIVTEQYPPFQQIEDNNQVSGSATRLVRMLMEQANLPYQIFVYPWPRALKELETSPATLLYSMLKIPSRQTKYQWIAPLCPVTSSFYHLTSRNDIKIRELSDIRNFRIGVERAQGKTDVLISHGFIDNLVESSTNKQLRKMMKFNRIDLILITDAYAQSLPASEKNTITKAFTVKELTRTMYLVGHQHMDQHIKDKLVNAYHTLKHKKSFSCQM